MSIGFIGQGWIGKNYADDFEARGYPVVRYSLEEPFIQNKEKIKGCDIVFIAVPTPTTPKGFDDSVVREAVKLVGKGKIAVIKSTIVPGTTESVQKENPDIFVLHSPEFLVESTAAYDAAHPARNIIGIPLDDKVLRQKAKMVIDILPKAPCTRIIPSKDAEFVKYAGNCFLFMKVIYMNLLYDAVTAGKGSWETVKDALVHDPRIGTSHSEPIHKSGRGAGGDCFIKDFETFKRIYKKDVNNKSGNRLLDALKNKNIELLVHSAKDIDLLRGVYGNVLLDSN
ncbi:MAG: hypothetical protein WCT02_03220 [Candidatus Paceibacterota bacterium]